MKPGDSFHLQATFERDSQLNDERANIEGKPT